MTILPGTARRPRAAAPHRVSRFTSALVVAVLILALLLGLWDATQHLHSYQELGLQGV